MPLGAGRLSPVSRATQTEQEKGHGDRGGRESDVPPCSEVGEGTGWTHSLPGHHTELNGAKAPACSPHSFSPLIKTAQAGIELQAEKKNRGKM